MKFKRIGLLWKHGALGFLIGLFIVVPEFFFLKIKLTHGEALRLSTIILGTAPFVLGFLSYKFGSAKSSLLRTNIRLLNNQKERQALLDEMIEYKLALDESSSVTVIDEFGKIKRVNEKFVELTGYQASHVIGRAIWRLPSSIQKEEVFNKIKSVTDLGQVWRGEIVYFKRKDGMKYTSAIVVPLTKKEGGNNDCLVIQYDITKERTAEVALRKIEEENKVILENTQTLICTHDAKGNIMNINAAGAKMLGYTPEQLVGLSVSNFLGANVPLETYLQNVLTNGHTEGYFRVISKDGVKRSLLFKNVVCQKEGEPYVIGSAIDITETIRVQKELEHQKAFISLLIDVSPNMIMVIDEQDRITLKNKVIQAYFNVDEDDDELTLSKIKAKNAAFNQLFPCPQNCIENEPEYSTEECRFYNEKTGEHNWFKVQRTIFDDKRGKKFLLLIATDITEKNKTECELIEAKKMVENTLKAKEQFFANMSHEIRTPLNSIIGFSYLLEDTLLDESQMDYLKTIKIAGKNLLSIINDVLDLSKMVTGNLTLTSNVMNLDEVVNNVARLFGSKVKDKGIYLNVIPSAIANKNVNADEDRLNQILINLVGNAIKFTQQGGVDIHTAQVTGTDPTKTYIRFSIKDSGIGIEKDKSEIIFKQYAQASNEINKSFGGTGLGLSIVKNLVELFGGEIKLESEIHVGTTVSVTIPFEASSATCAEPYVGNLITSDKIVFERPLKILLADDNNTNAKLAMKIMSRHNFIVQHVRDGMEVLTALEENEFDVILMDVQMINLNGIETTKIIRAKNAPYSDIPIVALTAHSFTGKRDVCREAGMDAYLSKPYNPEQLFSVISSAISHTAVFQ